MHMLYTCTQASIVRVQQLDAEYRLAETAGTAARAVGQARYVEISTKCRRMYY